MKNKKVNKNKTILLYGVIFMFLAAAGAVTGCSYFGKSNYEKGTDFLKDKKFTEALYEFQKVEPGNKNFINAHSKIDYINGLIAFNEGRKTEAVALLSKVLPDDEYYHDARLMIQSFNEASNENALQSQTDEMKNNKDTVIIKKEINGIPKKVKEPIDPVIKADQEISRKFVSDAANSVSRFENIYQSAKSAALSAKSDYSKSLESVGKEFNFIKYSAQNKNPDVLELKRMITEWMNKRIAFIRQLIVDKTVDETGTSRPLREEGDRLYTAMVIQMNKAKKL